MLLYQIEARRDRATLVNSQARGRDSNRRRSRRSPDGYPNSIDAIVFNGRITYSKARHYESRTHRLNRLKIHCCGLVRGWRNDFARGRATPDRFPITNDLYRLADVSPGDGLIYARAFQTEALPGLT